MKSLFVFLGLSILFGTSAQVRAQPALESVRSEGLFGPVKTVEEKATGHVMVNGKIVPGESDLVRRLSFDRSGNMVEGVYYGDVGVLPPLRIVQRHIVFTFDDRGRPSGYRSHPAGWTTEPVDHVFERDAAGRIWDHQVLQRGELVQRYTYLYGSSGEVLEESKYIRSGNSTRTVTVWEPEKRRSTRTRSGADGEMECTTVEMRDAVGRAIREEVRCRGESPIVYERSYDGKGRIKEVLTSRPGWPPGVTATHDINPGKRVYEYDDARNILEWTDFRGEKNQIRNFTVFERRNDRGDVIEDWTIILDGQLAPVRVDLKAADDSEIETMPGRRVIEYEYDKYGNWTRKKFLVRTPNWKGLVHYRTEDRKISYH